MPSSNNDTQMYALTDPLCRSSYCCFSAQMNNAALVTPGSKSLFIAHKLFDI